MSNLRLGAVADLELAVRNKNIQEDVMVVRIFYITLLNSLVVDSILLCVCPLF